MLKSIDLKENPTFDEEIIYIQAVQDAVLDASELFLKIPLGQSREPQDLLSSGHGQCSDRARSIEKALKYSGFDVRFFSAFSSERTFIPEDIRKNSKERFLRSHALVEVKTSKGWLIVDTNDRWISLDAENNPVSAETWQNVKDKERFSWTNKNRGEIYWLLRGDFMIFYGLYSRHGLFYPPYTPYIPDINLQTMIKGHLF
ncbi:MAG: transglutaminase domain-containing protein [Bdellovibrionales bacterium]